MRVGTVKGAVTITESVAIELAIEEASVTKCQDSARVDFNLNWRKPLGALHASTIETS
jgi:hypothetical protein